MESFPPHCNLSISLEMWYFLHISQFWDFYKMETTVTMQEMLFFFLVVVLGFELRALYLLGRSSTAGTMPPALFALIILDIGSCFLPRPAWTSIFLCYTSRGLPFPASFCSDGVLKAGQEPQSSRSISTSQVTRIMGVSHQHPTSLT
jgi:hypothetical protein